MWAVNPLLSENRYFTERKVAPNLESLPFLFSVDEHRILQQYDPQFLLHSEENQVEYITILDRKREKSVPILHWSWNLLTILLSLHPKVFAAGDIVEIVISVTTVPIKNNHLKSFLILQGVCLLDSSFQKAHKTLHFLNAMVLTTIYSVLLI